MLGLGDLPSSGLHFFGPEPDIIAATAGAAAVAVWASRSFAASPEQVRAVLTAIGAVRVAVVSWGVGSVAAKIGDPDPDVFIDVPVPRARSVSARPRQ